MTTGPETAQTGTTQPPMSTLRTAWLLVRYRTWLFLGTILFRGADDVVPFATGLIMKAFFDTLTGDADAGFNAWTLVALFVVIEFGDRVVLFFASLVGARWRFSIFSLLRTNLLTSILALRNPRSVTAASGETTNRFRDDAEGVVSYLEQYIHLWGNLIFATLAIVWMADIDVTITLITVIPAVLIITIVDIARKHIVRFRQAQREATEQSTNFVNEMFQSVLALQVAASEGTAVERYRRLNDARRKSTIVDNLFNQILGSVNVNIGQLATGAILLLVAERMRNGEFSVGDFVLFTTYVPEVARSGSLIGRVMAQHRRAEVSIERMSRMVESDSPAPLVSYRPVHLSADPPPIPPPEALADHPLHSLHAEGLTCLYPGTTTGVHDIDLRIDDGEFVVVTGRIGSGKTTLVRALLGLLPLDRGRIRWNGEPITDPKSFLVPPRCAYTPQVPRLFSETLRDNILLGLPRDDDAVEAAVRMGVMEHDIPTLEKGLETVVGPRGVKLSGGQIQRAAAARMFVRQAQLYVFDDLSSALDVDTERTLWQRLFEARHQTCLVVSHRRPALQRADRIVLLKEGRVEATGTLDELLDTSEEMQSLWRGDVES